MRKYFITAFKVCLTISMACFLNGAFPQSDTLALRTRLQSASGAERAGLLNKLAKSYLDINPTVSLKYAAEALSLAGAAEDLNEKALALYIMADAFYFMDSLDQAIKFYLSSASVEKEENGENSEGYINRIGDAGHCYYTIDRYAEAMAYFKESLELSLKEQLLTQAASMYSNIGNIYVVWGDYEKGLDYHQKALEIDRKTGGNEQIAIDLNNIGKIYEKWGHYNEAVKYYQESLELARTLDNPSMVAIRLNNLGYVYKAWERFNEALDYFQQALQIEQKQGNMQKVGRRLINIAATCLSMKQYAKCQGYLDQAFPLIQKSGLHDDLAGYHQVYGNYELSTGNHQKAIDHFQQSQQIALGNNLKPIQLGNLLGLSESYEYSGNFREALEYRKIYSTLKDTVFKTESSKKLAEFHAKFENNKMMMENEALKRDAEWKRKVFLVSGIASGAIVITLLLVISLLRLKTRNASQARQIAEQRTNNLELELELRNKELTCNAMAIIKKNEAVTEMVEALEQAAAVEKNPEFIGSLIEKFRNHEKDTNWKEFEMRFTQVHKDFYDKLHEKFPDLTPNERKLCAFLRLNMTTKDIASITHQSVHSINVARTRLRKKMNLANSDENLISFLTSL